MPYLVESTLMLTQAYPSAQICFQVLKNELTGEISFLIKDPQTQFWQH